MTTLLTPPAVHLQAADLCQALAALAAVPAPFGPKEWYTIAQLARLIEAVPPTVADLDVMCYLRNHWRASVQAIRDGERGAAGYQLRQMGLKLATLGGEDHTARAFQTGGPGLQGGHARPDSPARSVKR